MLQLRSSNTNTPKAMTKISQFNRKRFIIISVVTAFIGSGLVAPAFVRAATYQQQIDSLNQQNANKRDDIGLLDTAAADLQDAIGKLKAEIANLQAQIVANETKRDDTMRKIAAAEAELLRQKGVLAEALKSIYVKGQMSNLEELATSKDFAEFADSEQYRDAVQNNIQRTLDSIKALKGQLAVEKSNLELMIANLQEMRTNIAAQQAEQSRLLALNQAQQVELDGQIKANGNRVAELRRMQAAENARLAGGGNSRGSVPAGVPGGGGYPGRWAFASIDSMVDTWGMYNRQCVSYTAWKVWSSGRYMPYWGGRGNAKQWDDNAKAAGIPVTEAPAANTVAVSNAGTWGHTMWVESVNGDGSINVSDYNQQFDGLYREYTISADNIEARGLVFIHFK